MNYRASRGVDPLTGWRWLRVGKSHHVWDNKGRLMTHKSVHELVKYGEVLINWCRREQ